MRRSNSEGKLYVSISLIAVALLVFLGFIFLFLFFFGGFSGFNEYIFWINRKLNFIF